MICHQVFDRIYTAKNASAATPPASIGACIIFDPHAELLSVPVVSAAALLALSLLELPPVLPAVSPGPAVTSPDSYIVEPSMIMANELSAPTGRVSEVDAALVVVMEESPAIPELAMVLPLESVMVVPAI